MDPKKRKLLISVAQALINECDEPFIAEHITTFLHNNIKLANKRKILAVGAAEMNANLMNFNCDEVQLKNKKSADARSVEDVQESRNVWDELSYFSINPTDEHFRELFRVDKTTFEVLLKSLSIVFHPPDKPTHPCSLQPQEKLLLMLYILGNQESFRNVASRFNLNPGNCYCIYMNFCKQLAEAVTNFITWPGREQRERIQETFNEIYNIKNVIGIIGSVRISIKQPATDTSKDKTGSYSVSLQAVCDHHMKFIDIATGWMGSSNNINIWKNSLLYQQLQSNDPNCISPEEHLIGSEDYPLDEFMMTPFPTRQELSLEQLHYNSIHNEMTALIKKAFGHLLSRFQRLRLMDVLVMEKISKIITAACIFHNLIMETENKQDNFHFNYEITATDIMETDTLQSYDDAATVKRNKLCMDLISRH